MHGSILSIVSNNFVQRNIFLIHSFESIHVSSHTHTHTHQLKWSRKTLFVRCKEDICFGLRFVLFSIHCCRRFFIFDEYFKIYEFFFLLFRFFCLFVVVTPSSLPTTCHKHNSATFFFILPMLFHFLCECVCVNVNIIEKKAAAASFKLSHFALAIKSKTKRKECFACILIRSQNFFFLFFPFKIAHFLMIYKFGLLFIEFIFIFVKFAIHFFLFRFVCLPNNTLKKNHCKKSIIDTNSKLMTLYSFIWSINQLKLS